MLDVAYVATLVSFTRDLSVVGQANVKLAIAYIVGQIGVKNGLKGINNKSCVCSISAGTVRYTDGVRVVYSLFNTMATSVGQFNKYTL